MYTVALGYVAPAKRNADYTKKIPLLVFVVDLHRGAGTCMSLASCKNVRRVWLSSVTCLNRYSKLVKPALSKYPADYRGEG